MSQLFDRFAHLGGRLRPDISLDAIAGLRRGVEADLGDQAALLHRLGAVGAGIRNQHQVALELHPVGARPVDRNRIPRIDVIVDHGDALDEVDRREHREHHAAGLSRARRGDLHHDIRAAGARLGDRDVAHIRRHCGDGALQARGDRQRREVHVLAVISGFDDLQDRIAATGQGAEGGEISAAVVLVHAVKFRHEALLDRLARIDASFQHQFGLGRHHQIDRARPRPL